MRKSSSSPPTSVSARRIRARAWSEADLHWLRWHIGILDEARLAQELSRTVRDIRAKLQELASHPREEPLGLEEAQEFKSLYGTRTDEDLSVIFSRTLDFVTETARRLCLAKDKAFLRRVVDHAGVTTMPRWRKEELVLLRRLYPTHSNLEIASRLKRSVKSVVSKAYHLGLKKEMVRLREMGRENVSLRHARAAREA